MRIFFSLLAIIVVLVWLGITVRPRDRSVAMVLFGFAGVFAVMLVAAFFGAF